MKKTPFVLGVVGLLTFAVAFCVAADKRFEKKFSVKPGGTLMLRTDVGSVKVAGTAGGEVSIVAVMRGTQRQIDEFEITADETAGGVEVKGTRKGTRWGSYDLDVEFSVTVPTEYNLKLGTSGSDLDVKGLKGSVDGETSGGDIRVHDVSGTISLGTSGGNIEAKSIAGNARLKTSGGNVIVGSSAGEVDAQTSGGDVVVEASDAKVFARTSGGDVHVAVRGAFKGIDVQTSGGDIEIALAKNAAATLDASTSGGDVECDIPVTVSGKLNESQIRGTVNGGGSPIRAHTSGGDIHIRGLK
jgi:hypothetical protein